MRGTVAICAGLLSAALVTLLILGDGLDTWDLRTVEVSVPVPNLPDALEGLRIAHISDLHIYDGQPEGYVGRAVDAVCAASPDMIVNTGDMVSFDWRDMEPSVRDLARLRAPRGVYACLGNHDRHYGRGPHITRLLGEAGMRVLADEAVEVPGCPGAWLVGLDMYGPNRVDFEKALSGVPDGAFRVLLAHSPDVAPPAAELGIDLMLSGHTHGGQVCLPIIGPPVVPSSYGPRYASGLLGVEGMRLFVTRGVGSDANACRFRCPPEVAVLTLTRSDAAVSQGHIGVNLSRSGRQLVPLRRGVKQALRGVREVEKAPATAEEP